MNSVQIISTLAEADFVLTCRAIRHLLYYGCIFLLDIFSFSAIYAPTAKFGSTIASDEEMQRECACYVNTRFASMPVNLGRSTSASGASQSGSVSRVRKDISCDNSSVDQNDIWPPLGDTTTTMTSNKQSNKVVDGVRIVELYASLKQGQSVKQWYLEHMNELANIDVRRFITFGVIKGFLYRVHKYAYDTGYPTHHPTTRTHRTISHVQTVSRAFPRDRIGSAASTVDPSAIRSRRSSEAYYNHYSLREEDKEDEDDGEAEAVDDDEDEDAIDDKTRSKYLDGMHCFDQICTELEISEQELTARLKRYPSEVVIIHR